MTRTRYPVESAACGIFPEVVALRSGIHDDSTRVDCWCLTLGYKSRRCRKASGRWFTMVNYRLDLKIQGLDVGRIDVGPENETSKTLHRRGNDSFACLGRSC